MDDMMAVIRGMPNWKAVEPDSLASESLKRCHLEFTRYFPYSLANAWRTGDAPQHGKKVTLKFLNKKKDRFDCSNNQGVLLVAHSETHC